MRYFFSLFLSALFAIAFSEIFKKSENIKALWNLEEVTECELHYNALTYNNYGCWCGIGGSHEPVDPIDECCMHHDKCYDAAVDAKICMNVEIEYVDDYKWSCTDSKAICSPQNVGCKAALCECDKIVVECWKQYPKPVKKAKCNRTWWSPNTTHFHH